MGVVADRWLLQYREMYDTYCQATSEIEEQVRVALAGRAFEIHVIESRTKTPDSAAEKIERKSYGIPARQMTDIIGIRIITMFDHTVGLVEQRLKEAFRWDSDDSVDKTRLLAHGQVGYRSVHLVIHPRVTGLGETSKILRSARVEIQIRSLIAHAWAEIEHSIRYKSGASVPEKIRRRFDALAGTLELVDTEFSAIAIALSNHVDAMAARYRSSLDLADPIDTLELLAAIRAARPDAVRQGPDGLILPLEEGHRFAIAIQSAGISSVGALLECLKRTEVHDLVRRYCTGNDYDSSTVSGAIWLGAVLRLHDPGLLARFSRFDDLEVWE